MKVIVVGGTGTLGKAVVQELQKRHEVVSVGATQGEVQVNIEDLTSIQQMYAKLKPFDAVICAAGKVDFSPLVEMTKEKYLVGLQNKLMGQINLVMAGLPIINDKGSFTLISGILSEDPILMGSSAAMVNGAIDAFVRAAAIEMPRGIRINAINPTVFVESLPFYEPYFRGFSAVPTARVAVAFSKSVEGAQTGQVYKVW